MRVHILLVVICGILAVSGSPLDTDAKKKSSEDVKAADALTENKTTKTADLSKGTDNDSKSETADADDSEQVEGAGESFESDEVEDAKLSVQTKSEELSDKLEEESASESKSEEATHKHVEETPELPERQPIDHSSVFAHTTTVFESQSSVPERVQNVGPVEHDLRNVVAASAAATEEFYMGMSALTAETSHMMSSKSEILTSQTINRLFTPLNKVETVIRKTGDCGKAYEASLSAIFKDIDTNLKSCSKNLTAIEAQYKNDNVGALTSLAFATDEMNNLPDSCEIAVNFAVGTFCIVNNLAEMNERVLSDVSFIKQNTAKTEEQITIAIAAIDVCQQKMSEAVSGKLANLLQEVTHKCVERKNGKSK